MMIRRLFVVAAVAAVVAGCTGGSDPAPSTSPTSSVSASGFRTAVEWVLTAEGFGPVKLGEKIPEGYTVTPETQCTGYQLLDGEGKPAIELWTAENGEVTTIVATENTTLTSGVKIGDGADAVAAAYPDAVAETLTGRETQVVRGEANALVFELVDSKVAHISLQPTAGLHAVGASACE